MQFPEKLDEASLFKIFELIKEYPYFQTAHLLLLKNLHNQDNIKFNKQLKISSSHIASRKKLFYLLNDENSNKFLSDKLKDYSVDSNERISISEARNQQQKIAEELRLKYLKDLHSDENEPNENINSNLESENPKKNIQNPVESEIEFIDETKIAQQKDQSKSHIKEEESSNIENEAEKSVLPQPNDRFSEFPDLETQNSSNNYFEKSDVTEDNGKSLIDAFIKNSPRIEVSKNRAGTQIDRSKASEMEDPNLITETLAKVYIKQKHYSKALKIYDKLILKYPQKNIYFAARKKEVENIVKNL